MVSSCDLPYHLYSLCINRSCRSFLLHRCRALTERIEWKRGQDEALSRLVAEGADGDGALPAELASDMPVCPKICE